VVAVAAWVRGKREGARERRARVFRLVAGIMDVVVESGWMVMAFCVARELLWFLDVVVEELRKAKMALCVLANGAGEDADWVCIEWVYIGLRSPVQPEGCVMS